MTREEIDKIVKDIEEIIYDANAHELDDKEEQKKLDKITFFLRHAMVAGIELKKILD